MKRAIYIAIIAGLLIGSHYVTRCQPPEHECQAEAIARLALERADQALVEQETAHEATMLALDAALIQLRQSVRVALVDVTCLVRPYHRLLGRSAARDYETNEIPVPALWAPHSPLVMPPGGDECSARFRVREERR